MKKIYLKKIVLPVFFFSLSLGAFSKAESKKSQNNAELCRKYEGSIVAYYGEVFRVKDCKRFPLLDSEKIYELTAKKIPIHSVDSEVIQKIPEASSVSSGSVTPAKEKDLCREYEKKYITHSYVSIYYVEKCRKRLFASWEAYLAHRGRKSAEQSQVHGVESELFYRIATGEPMPDLSEASDEAHSQGEHSDKPIEIIPVDEACEGLEGHWVSYYGQVYKIQKCRKALVEDMTLIPTYVSARMKELSAEQWISLPDGEPIDSSSQEKSRTP